MRGAFEDLRVMRWRQLFSDRNAFSKPGWVWGLRANRGWPFSLLMAKATFERFDFDKSYTMPRVNGTR